MKDFAVIALIALAITIVVTIIGTTLLLRQARKPEDERKGEIFQPEHIDDPQTEEDWKKWDNDDWSKDEWEEQWQNWDYDRHAPAEASDTADAQREHDTKEEHEENAEHGEGPVQREEKDKKAEIDG